MAMAGAPLREHPFEQRTDGLEPRVEVGLWVRVGRRSERFWCEVRSIRADGAFVACVDNDLLRNPYRCGDELVLRACHVLETADLRDCMSFRGLAAALGPMSGAMAWLTAREDAAPMGVAAKPNTRYMVGRRDVASQSHVEEKRSTLHVVPLQ